jgi:hypothetical protein
MVDPADFQRKRPTARILLICPDCGQENAEFAEKLRGTSSYFCRGDGCDYSFELAAGPSEDLGNGFAEVCMRFYASLSTMRGRGIR